MQLCTIEIAPKKYSSPPNALSTHDNGWEEEKLYAFSWEITEYRRGNKANLRSSNLNVEH